MYIPCATRVPDVCEKGTAARTEKRKTAPPDPGPFPTAAAPSAAGRMWTRSTTWSAPWPAGPGQSASTATAMIEGNDGTIPHAVTVRDVPVGAFWSVTVYDADGHHAPNALGRNSYNDFTAAPNEDGSITLNFDRCEDGRIN